MRRAYRALPNFYFRTSWIGAAITTQFILFSGITDQSSTGTLNFFGKTGGL